MKQALRSVASVNIVPRLRLRWSLGQLQSCYRCRALSICIEDYFSHAHPPKRNSTSIVNYFHWFSRAFIMLDLLQYQMIITLVLDVRPWFRNFKYSLIPNFDPDWSLSWPTPSLCLRRMLPRNALPLLRLMSESQRACLLLLLRLWLRRCFAERYMDEAEEANKGSKPFPPNSNRGANSTSYGDSFAFFVRVG